MQPRHTAVRIEQSHIQVGLATISYQAAGSGPPLVLIHGLSGSCRWWERNVADLARQFRVYVIDLIGFGESVAPHPFVLKETAPYLAAWMDRLDIPRANVVGHSMGGVIAADFAADYASRIDRLVLVDAAVYVAEQNYLRHALGVINEFVVQRPHFLPVLVNDAYRAGPMTLAKAAIELLTTNIEAKLRQIQSPTLVVWGERDAITPLDAGRRMCRYLSNGRMVAIKGAGHNPMWEVPQTFNRIITEFIAPATPATDVRRLFLADHADASNQRVSGASAEGSCGMG